MIDNWVITSVEPSAMVWSVCCEHSYKYTCTHALPHTHTHLLVSVCMYFCWSGIAKSQRYVLKTFSVIIWKNYLLIKPSHRCILCVCEKLFFEGLIALIGIGLFGVSISSYIGCIRLYFSEGFVHFLWILKFIALNFS